MVDYSPDVQAYLDARAAYEAQHANDGGTLVATPGYQTSYLDPSALSVMGNSGYFYDQNGDPVGQDNIFTDHSGNYVDQNGNPITTAPQKTLYASDDDLRAIMGTPLDQAYQHQYYELTNQGHPAGNFTVGTDTPIRIVDSASGDVLYSGAGVEGANAVTSLAQQLSKDQGSKANWTIETLAPNGSWVKGAQDKPPTTPLGKIADIGLPILGGVLGSVIPGIGTAIGAGLGAAAGSSASSIAQGRSLGDTLKGAAISGLGAFGGGELLGALGAGGSGAAGGAGSAASGAAGGAAGAAGGGSLGGLAGDIVVNALPAITGGIASAVPGVIGGALGAGAGGALSSAGSASPQPNDITVTARPPITTVPSGNLAAGLGLGVAGTGAALAGAGGGASEAPAANDITVTANPAITSAPGNGLAVDLGVGAAGAGALAAAAGGGGADAPITVTANDPITAPPDSGLAADVGAGAAGAAAGDLAATGPPENLLPDNPSSTLSQIEKYLELAGLGTGLLGNLLGGGTGGSGAKIPAGFGGGALPPVFNGSLPPPNIPGVGDPSNLGARVMPSQDWYRYGMRPAQSFFNYVPQTYAPPAAGTRDPVWDQTLVARG